VTPGRPWHGWSATTPSFGTWRLRGGLRSGGVGDAALAEQTDDAGLKLAAKSVLAVAYSGRETFASASLRRRESPHREISDLGRMCFSQP